MRITLYWVGLLLLCSGFGWTVNGLAIDCTDCSCSNLGGASGNIKTLIWTDSLCEYYSNGLHAQVPFGNLTSSGCAEGGMEVEAGGTVDYQTCDCDELCATQVSDPNAGQNASDFGTVTAIGATECGDPS